MSKKASRRERLRGYLDPVTPEDGLVTFLGIDPGWGGAFTFLTFPQGIGGGAPPVRETVPMPGTEDEIWDALYRRNEHGHGRACLEKVGGFAGTPHTGASMFKFGHNYGACRMGLRGREYSEGWTYYCPTPQEWQASLGLSPRKPGEKDAGWKARIKLHLFTLVPWQDFPVASADSVAIAIYCALLFGGDRLRWPADWGVSRLKERLDAPTA